MHFALPKGPSRIIIFKDKHIYPRGTVPNVGLCPVLRIVGGQPLEGELQVNGSKNAALPIIAATLLTDGEVRLKNVPDLVDVRVMLSLCRVSGMEFGYRGGDLIVRTGQIRECPTRPEAGSIRRPSLARPPPAVVTFRPLPGGCLSGTGGSTFTSRHSG